MLEQYPVSESVVAVCKLKGGSLPAGSATGSVRPNDAYAALLPNLLKPALWEMNAVVPALARLIQAYLLHNVEAVIASNKVHICSLL